MISPICPKSSANGALQHRVDRRQQRLHRVVQQVAEADGAENRERCALVSPRHARGARASMSTAMLRHFP